MRPDVESFTVRCCLCDLVRLVVPRLRGAMADLPAGAFLAGRMVPVAGTDLWTMSGVHETLPESAWQTVAAATSEMALQAPWRTHRNPEYLVKALASSTGRNDFIWAHDGEQLLASAPGDQEPMPTVAILPTICTRSAVASRPE